MRCCVPLCTSKSSKDCNISFHPFPADEKRQEVWQKCLKVNKVSLIRNKDLRVCSKHFLEADYLVGTNIKKLKKSAIPFIDQQNISPECKSGENVEATHIKKIKKRKLRAKRNLSYQDSINSPNDTSGNIFEHIFSLQTTLNEQREEIETLKLQVSALQTEVKYLKVENQRVKAGVNEVEPKEPFFTFIKVENDDSLLDQNC